MNIDSSTESRPAFGHRPDRPISAPQVLACCAATLVGYVGIVHEVVGSTLYPDGPATFGGPVGWHAAGLFAIAAGLLLAGGALQWVRVPVVPLALTVGVIGGVVFVGDLLHGAFHLFAFTLVVACAALAVSNGRGSDR